METKEYFEKVMQDFNQNRRGRNLRKYCSDEGIDYKWLSEYKKQYSSSKGKVEKEEEPSLIPLQVIDERFSEQPVVQPEAKWCVKQLVIASPTGDELEIKCSNLAVVVELLRKMSMQYAQFYVTQRYQKRQHPNRYEKRKRRIGNNSP